MSEWLRERQEDAYIDPLTDLGNRRFAFAHVESVMAAVHCAQYGLSHRLGRGGVSGDPARATDEGLEISTERLRMLVEHCWIQAGEEQIRVTIAAGIEVARVQETVDELLDRADRLMWCSKNAGRNIVSSDAGQLARVGDLWPRIRRALDDRTGR